MAAWLPVLKVALPYIASVASTAIPAFTQRGDGKSQAVLNQQISELQDAAARNAESVRVLAEQMQRTVSAIEAGAESSQRTLRQAQWLAATALVIALGSLGTTLFLLAG